MQYIKTKKGRLSNGKDCQPSHWGFRCTERWRKTLIRWDLTKLGKLSGWFTSLIMLGASSVARKCPSCCLSKGWGRWQCLGVRTLFAGLLLMRSMLKGLGHHPGGVPCNVGRGSKVWTSRLWEIVARHPHLPLGILCPSCQGVHCKTLAQG